MPKRNSDASGNARHDLEMKIMKGLLSEGMIKTWMRDKPEGWTLASGLYSPFFINLRLISSTSPQLYQDAAQAMGMLLDEVGFVAGEKRRMVGIAMAGIPFANALTLYKNIPSLYTRKLPEEVKTPQDVENYLKAHGAKALVEGEMESGDTLAMIDDLVTKFDSKLLAISQTEQEVKRRGLKDVKIKDVFVLLDREQGAAEIAKQNGFNLHAVIPFTSRGLALIKDSLDPKEYEVIADYLKDPKKYQNKEMQDRLKEMAQKR